MISTLKACPAPGWANSTATSNWSSTVVLTAIDALEAPTGRRAAFEYVASKASVLTTLWPAGISVVSRESSFSQTVQ